MHSQLNAISGRNDPVTYIVVIEQDGETARLACETLEEAQMVRRSFFNYGKCSDVRIESVAGTPKATGAQS